MLLTLIYLSHTLKTPKNSLIGDPLWVCPDSQTPEGQTPEIPKLPTLGDLWVFCPPLGTDTYILDPSILSITTDRIHFWSKFSLIPVICQLKFAFARHLTDRHEVFAGCKYHPAE